MQDKHGNTIQPGDIVRLSGCYVRELDGLYSILRFRDDTAVLQSLERTGLNEKGLPRAECMATRDWRKLELIDKARQAAG